MEVPRHPHTGLATVSWLFTGTIEVVRDLPRNFGVAAFYEGHLLSVLTIRTDGERILDVYALLNPDKLQGFELPAVH